MAYQNKKLRYLPFGAETDIAKKYGVTTQHVHQVLIGKRTGDYILEDLIKMANENRAKLFKIQQDTERVNKPIDQGGKK